MFKYFPTNYVWNLSVDLAIEMGARIGEIEAMCAPLQEAARQPDAAGTLAFRETWSRMAEKLCGLAQDDEAKGRLISAGHKYRRAAIYLLTCERLQAHDAPGRDVLYQRFLDVFARGVDLSGEACERVRIPYGGNFLSALYVPRGGAMPGERSPLLVQVNGLDSTKELKYFVGLPQWLAERGVASLVLDQPGSGDALRQRGLVARFDAEHWAGPVVDWLETQPEVDPLRIGMEGVSLGGYYCPRAVAFEPRFACGVVWGANHDWRDVQTRRLAREGDLPVPHYWAHVCWVWGAKDIDDFMRIAQDVHLDGILGRIEVPFLVTHGEKDSQIPLKWAHATYDQLVHSPKRELKVFTEREGGVQHSSFDNAANAGAWIADWVAETLGGRTPCTQGMTMNTAHPSLALKLIILGRRRPGSTLAEHRRHIRQVHGEMVLDYIAHDAAAPQRYVQNVVLDGTYRPTAPAVDPLALQRDFVTQIWFADFAALARSRETAFYRERLHGDEDNFVDQASVVFVPTREHSQWQREAAGGASIKLFCGMQRSPGIAPEVFLQAWLEAAAGLPSLPAVPGVQRHVCNEVLGRPGQPSSLDGIDEFWLDDEKAAHALLAQWRGWIDQTLVRAGLVAADIPFFLITREDVLHAGPG